MKTIVLAALLALAGPAHADLVFKCNGKQCSVFHQRLIAWIERYCPKTCGVAQTPLADGRQRLELYGADLNEQEAKALRAHVIADRPYDASRT